MHGLAFGEVDADDLPLDLGAHDVGVVRNHRADAAKIDRHVMLGDGPGDDRHRRRWSGRGIDLLQWLDMPEVKQTAAHKRRSQQGCSDNDFLFHGRSRLQMKNIFTGEYLTSQMNQWPEMKQRASLAPRALNSPRCRLSAARLS